MQCAKERGVMKIKYEGKNFRSEALKVIEQAETIINQYSAQGFSLTLRQLYYQFVSRGLIPNTDKSYNRLGNIISDARRAGMIDWDSIVDRTRYLRKQSSWGKPQSILESARDSYHRDLWANQDRRLEVWIEKDALVGVIEDVCNELDVPFFSCRGYVSDSEMWSCAMRIYKHERDDNQDTLLVHLGDHDPSGIDMTRDITDRLSLFSSDARGAIEIHRIALTMEQIKELTPPPNPAKITDSRYQDYADKYGDESWELDALEPSYIVNIIRETIEAERNDDRWNESVAEQEMERKQIGEVVNRWGELFK